MNLIQELISKMKVNIVKESSVRNLYEAGKITRKALDVTLEDLELVNKLTKFMNVETKDELIESLLNNENQEFGDWLFNMECDLIDEEFGDWLFNMECDLIDEE